MQPIRVLIYEDNDYLRDTLVQVLMTSDKVEVLNAYTDCRNVKQQVELYQPDVVLMDIDMPFVNGIEGTRIISSNYPLVQIIMLTVFDDDDKIFEAIFAGAAGYLLKKTEPQKLINAIVEVKDGGVPMTAQIARKVLNVLASKNKGLEREEHNLSQREMEILNCLVKGLSYKLIASELSISIDTVRTHIKKVYEKLHVNSATEAVSKALQKKIIF